MAKYSIAEIDRMRAAIEGGSYFPTDDMKRAALVEDRLRTHMQNGTTVEELEQVAGAFRQKWEAEWAKHNTTAGCIIEHHMPTHGVA